MSIGKLKEVNCPRETLRKEVVSLRLSYYILYIYILLFSADFCLLFCYAIFCKKMSTPSPMCSFLGFLAHGLCLYLNDIGRERGAIFF